MKRVIAITLCIAVLLISPVFASVYSDFSMDYNLILRFENPTSAWKYFPAFKAAFDANPQNYSVVLVGNIVPDKLPPGDINLFNNSADIDPDMNSKRGAYTLMIVPKNYTLTLIDFPNFLSSYKLTFPGSFVNYSCHFSSGLLTTGSLSFFNEGKYNGNTQDSIVSFVEGYYIPSEVPSDMRTNKLHLYWNGDPGTGSLPPPPTNPPESIKPKPPSGGGDSSGGNGGSGSGGNSSGGNGGSGGSGSGGGDSSGGNGGSGSGGSGGSGSGGDGSGGNGGSGGGDSSGGDFPFPPASHNPDFVPYDPDVWQRFYDHVAGNMGNAITVGIIILALILGVWIIRRVILLFENGSLKG